MKTREVLAETESNLTIKLKLMKIKELEKHIEKIFKHLGIKHSQVVIGHLIRELPKLEKNSEQRYQSVQLLVKKEIPESHQHYLHENDLLERITLIVIVLIRKKFDRIHNSHNHD